MIKAVLSAAMSFWKPEREIVEGSNIIIYKFQVFLDVLIAPLTRIPA